jgi:hypothetical protein
LLPGSPLDELIGFKDSTDLRMTEIPDISSLPPSPPRPLNAKARRQSWSEARVRIWWLLGLALFIIAAVFVGAQIKQSAENRNLLRVGVRVNAQIIEANGQTLRKLYPPEQNVIFKFKFKLPDGREHTISDRLKDQRYATGPGQDLPVVVDPSNPDRWTDRVETSWLSDLLVGMALGPIIAACIGIGLMKRRGILKTYREGDALVGVVHSVSTVAFSPGAQSIRFFLRDSDDQRVYSTIPPRSAGPFQEGDEFWLIVPRGAPNASIILRAYE